MAGGGKNVVDAKIIEQYPAGEVTLKTFTLPNCRSSLRNKIEERSNTRLPTQDSVRATSCIDQSDDDSASHRDYFVSPHLSGFGRSPTRCLECTSFLRSTFTAQVSRTRDSGRYSTAVPTKY